MMLSFLLMFCYVLLHIALLLQLNLEGIYDFMNSNTDNNNCVCGHTQPSCVPYNYYHDVIQDVVKTTVELIDLLGIYVTVTRIVNKGEMRIMVTSIGMYSVCVCVFMLK